MCPMKKRKVSTGSGKRFTSEKPRLQAAEPVLVAPRSPSSAETSLRHRISEFGLSERFREDVENAFEQYFGPGSIRREAGRAALQLAEAKVQPELPSFQEWLYTDYRLRLGKHIMDLFTQEIGPQLSFVQRKILGEWQATNCQRLLEVQSVTPGVGETVQDLLSGEVFTLRDISFSYHTLRWSVILARPLLTEGHWTFTGGGIVLTPQEKPQIMKIAKKLWCDYQEQHPQSSLIDFYRDHSLDLLVAARKVYAEQTNAPALTAEKHLALSASAYFSLLAEREEVEDILDESEEYVYNNDEDEGEFAGCSHYSWLLRGRSSVPEPAPDEEVPKGSLLLSSRWTAGEGEPDYLKLGDLYVCQNRLALLCTSRERLEVGKKLLGEILENKILHSQDDVKPFIIEPASPESPKPKPKPRELVDAEGLRVEDEIIERATREWLDKPANEGLTPRQLAQTPEGREKLLEMLKMLAYLINQAHKRGKKAPMRLDIILEELGLEADLL